MNDGRGHAAGSAHRDQPSLELAPFELMEDGADQHRTRGADGRPSAIAPPFTLIFSRFVAARRAFEYGLCGVVISAYKEHACAWLRRLADEVRHPATSGCARSGSRQRELYFA